MKEYTFRVGDVVRLRSGGPLMTVVRIVLSEIETRWFDSQQQLQVRRFSAGTLVHISNDEADDSGLPWLLRERCAASEMQLRDLQDFETAFWRGLRSYPRQIPTGESLTDQARLGGWLVARHKEYTK